MLKEFQNCCSRTGPAGSDPVSLHRLAFNRSEPEPDGFSSPAGPSGWSPPAAGRGRAKAAGMAAADWLIPGSFRLTAELVSIETCRRGRKGRGRRRPPSATGGRHAGRTHHQNLLNWVLRISPDPVLARFSSGWRCGLRTASLWASASWAGATSSSV